MYFLCLLLKSLFLLPAVVHGANSVSVESLTQSDTPCNQNVVIKFTSYYSHVDSAPGKFRIFTGNKFTPYEPQGAEVASTGMLMECVMGGSAGTSALPNKYDVAWAKSGEGYTVTLTCKGTSAADCCAAGVVTLTVNGCLSGDIVAAEIKAEDTAGGLPYTGENAAAIAAGDAKVAQFDGALAVTSPVFDTNCAGATCAPKITFKATGGADKESGSLYFCLSGPTVADTTLTSTATINLNPGGTGVEIAVAESSISYGVGHVFKCSKFTLGAKSANKALLAAQTEIRITLKSDNTSPIGVSRTSAPAMVFYSASANGLELGTVTTLTNKEEPKSDDAVALSKKSGLVCLLLLAMFL